MELHHGNKKIERGKVGWLVQVQTLSDVSNCSVQLANRNQFLVSSMYRRLVLSVVVRLTVHADQEFDGMKWLRWTEQGLIVVLEVVRVRARYQIRR